MHSYKSHPHATGKTLLLVLPRQFLFKHTWETASGRLWPLAVSHVLFSLTDYIALPGINTCSVQVYAERAFLLQFAGSHGTREGQDVTDVAHTCQVHDAALEAQAETGVADTAVAAKVEIELVTLFVEAEFVHALLEFFEVLFTLAAADDLTDAGNQAVHSCDGLAVVVQLHVEGLDLLGIVCDEDGALEFLLGEVALVLGLQITAPGYLIVEFIVVLLEDLDGIGIGHMSEIGVEDMVEAVQKALVDELVEEVHLFGCILQHIADDVFEHVFGQLHVVLEVCEAELGLDHPELSCVTGGVGDLCAESRSEGVDIAEGKGIGLDIKLAADGQVDWLAEKVLGVVDFSVLCSGKLLHGKGRHLEHLSCALGVAAGDDGRMYIDKAALLEEFVYREGDQGADTEHSGKGVGADTQMGNGAQVFKAVALFLQRIIRRGSTLDFNLFNLHFKRLLCIWCQNDSSCRDDGRADVEFCDLRKIFQFIRVYQLQCLEAASVIERDKTDLFRVAVGTDPSADCNGLVSKRFFCRKEILDLGQAVFLSHTIIPSF